MTAGRAAMSKVWRRVLRLAGSLLVRVEVHVSSMLPSLAPGDRVLVVRTTRIRCGDLVVFVSPNEPGRHLIKRVVGLGADGVVVRGDNEGVSTDSRRFGPVPRSSVVGRAWFRYLPSDARGRLRRVGAPPPAPAARSAPVR